MFIDASRTATIKDTTANKAVISIDAMLSERDVKCLDMPSFIPLTIVTTPSIFFSVSESLVFSLPTSAITDAKPLSLEISIESDAMVLSDFVNFLQKLQLANICGTNIWRQVFV